MWIRHLVLQDNQIISTDPREISSGVQFLVEPIPLDCQSYDILTITGRVDEAGEVCAYNHIQVMRMHLHRPWGYISPDVACGRGDSPNLLTAEQKALVCSYLQSCSLRAWENASPSVQRV
ncbi:MAG: hypothetical protein PHQ40_18050, partial [Anaerolineaceae bacterium]|nr:hypothetical protein [Anaerolineaceae bacterium]